MAVDWKSEVESSYNNWKYNQIHGEVKSYFNNIQDSPTIGQPFKRESTEFGANLSELKEEIKDKKNNDKVISKSDSNTVKFLGDEIDVGDEEEEIVDRFCKETIFSGFWKTITKLCNAVYLKLKSVGDVLKKLFKKLIDFIEAGMKSCVTALGNVISWIVGRIYPLPDYEVHEETGIKIVKNFNFVNYGETVQNVPQLTFFPKTVEDIQKVILFAKSEKKRVRCAGMKHSWSEMYSDTGEILIFLLPMSVTDTISFARTGLDGLEKTLAGWGSDLSYIQLVQELDGGKHAAVKVGSAVTNLEMLNWSNKSGWTMPADIIAVMITYGGSNAMICHGAGLSTQTLSDLVLEMEFVNGSGDLQKVTDRETLLAVAGCFGLAGVVTSITFRMDAMTWAKFHPKKTLMEDSLPRPGADVESEAFKKMVSLCENSYYVEFFWFPNNGVEDGYWENCWTNDGLEEDAIDINDSVDDNYQIASTYMFEIIMKILQPLTLLSKEEYYDSKTSLQEVLRYLFTKVVSMAGVAALPAPDSHSTTSLVEALHFRRGFHYIAVREMEMEIPIPSLPDGAPDWTIVSRAWWDAVDLIEKSEVAGVFAVDMALELRVMGGSQVLMAPQYGNKHGTLAIEPVSTRIVHKEVWEDFKVELAKVWMRYRDHDGSLLKSRVHWAKESPRTVTVEGTELDTVKYWHQLYQENMTKFFDILEKLSPGVTIDDIYNLFSNNYLDSLFQPQWERFSVRRLQEGNGLHVVAGEDGDRKSHKSECCAIV